MIFSRLLQCLFLMTYLHGGIGFLAYWGSPADARTTSDTPSKNSKSSQITITPGTNSSDIVTASIREQLQELNNPTRKVITPKKPIPIIKQEAKVTLTLKDDNLNVFITSPENIAGATVFAEGLNWYVVLAGVTDLTLEDYDATKLQNLQKTSTLKKEGLATILKISLKRKQTPEIIRNSKEIKLQFQNKPEISSGDDLIKLPKNPEDTYQIRVKGGYTSIPFEDKETNLNFWTLTMESPFRSISEHSYPQFILLESVLGFAIQEISEDLTIEYKRRKINITSENGLSVSPQLLPHMEIKPQSIFTEFNFDTANKRIVGLNRYIQSNNPDNLEKSIELIWQYLGLGKIPEALNMINIMKDRYPDLILIPTFRALDGLAQLLQNRVKKSENSLKVLNYDPEPTFWYLIAAASTNEFIDSESLHKLVNYKSHFMLLPLPLRIRLLAIILQTSILHKDTNVMESFINTNLKSQDIFLDQLIKLANALILLNHNHKEKAAKILDTLSRNPISQRVATISSFELLKLQKEQNKINSAEELAALNRLRFSWRGDFLEYYISKYYVNRLNTEKFYHKALPVLRGLTKYFPEQAHRDKLPKLMQQSLLDYFHQDSVPSLMESLSVFQEFGDIAPNSEEGDEIIIKATNKIMQLNLYQDAIDILNKYIEKKLPENVINEPRRNTFLYRIAAIELLSKKPKEALKTLQKITNPKGLIKDDLILIRAEALRQSGQPKEAMMILGETATQVEKKASFYFLDENWEEAASHYQKAMELFGEKDKENREKCIVNLALCLALQENSKEKLATIREIYGSSMQNSKYKDIFNFLTTETSADMTLTSAEFSKIESFTDNLKKIFIGDRKAPT